MRSSAVLILVAIVAHASACVSGPISGTSCTAECGVDHFGGDYASLSDSTFESCTEACNGDARCVTAQFVISSNTCYLKYYKTDASSNGDVNGVVCGGSSTMTTMASTSASTTMTASTFTTTTTTAASNPSCVNGAMVPGTNGCVAECGTDRFGGDYTNVMGTTFQACALLCSSDSRCVMAQFAISSSTCYLKHFETAASSDLDVNGVICPANGASTSMSTSTTSTTIAVTPSTTSTTSTATTSASGGSGGRVCTILQGQDRYGGDYAEINTGSFEACMGLCQADSQCLTAQYKVSSGNCYLKSVRNPLSDNGDVDTADCSSAPVTTTTTTTTPMVTPTTMSTTTATTMSTTFTVPTTTTMTTTTTSMASTTIAAAECSLGTVAYDAAYCSCTFERYCNSDSSTGANPAFSALNAPSGEVCLELCGYFTSCSSYVYNATAKSCAIYSTVGDTNLYVERIPGTLEVGLRTNCAPNDNHCVVYTPSVS